MSSYNNVIESMEKGLCSFCGACITVCPSQGLAVDVEASRPRFAGECKACRLCVKVCPQIDIDKELLDVEGYRLLKAYEGRITIDEYRDRVQDGGAVTAIAIAVLEEGLVDAVIATSRDSVWRPIVIIARRREDILLCSGTVYTYSPVLVALRQIAEDPSIKSVMVVGLPCHIRALEKMKRIRLTRYVDKVRYTVSLFCMHNFAYTQLKELTESLGIELGKVVKMMIRKGRFIFRTVEGVEHSVPIEKTYEGLRESCKRCPEFLSRYADVSVGSIGSAEGWSTIIVSSEKGAELIEVAVKRKLLEVKDLSEKGIKLVKRFMSKKVEDAKTFLEANSSS